MWAHNLLIQLNNENITETTLSKRTVVYCNVEEIQTLILIAKHLSKTCVYLILSTHTLTARNMQSKKLTTTTSLCKIYSVNTETLEASGGVKVPEAERTRSL